MLSSKFTEIPFFILFCFFRSSGCRLWLWRLSKSRIEPKRSWFWNPISTIKKPHWLTHIQFDVLWKDYYVQLILELLSIPIYRVFFPFTINNRENHNRDVYNQNLYTYEKNRKKNFQSGFPKKSWKRLVTEIQRKRPRDIVWYHLYDPDMLYGLRTQ